MTTRLVSDIAKKAGCPIIDNLLVGFKYVAHVLKTLDDGQAYEGIKCHSRELVLAVEESHGVLMAPDIRDATNARFLETGGPPPAGVTMLGRWHFVEGGEGFCICETDDAAALATWTQQWSDLLEFRITPVLDDEKMATVLG